MLQAAFLVLTACEKEQATLSDDMSPLSAENVAQSLDESLSADAEVLSLRTGGGDCASAFAWPDCAVITDSGEGYPRTIDVDWGEGCTDALGRVRTGIMHITLTGDMLEAGSVRTVTFEDYSINGREVSGSRHTTSLGTNDQGQPVFSETASIQFAHEGLTCERTVNHMVTWLAGYDTPECGDNLFSIEGEATVTRPNGITVHRVITDPLILDRPCGHIVSGVVSLNAPGGTATLDYGDGSCDNEALLVRPNGTQQVIVLGSM